MGAIIVLFSIATFVQRTHCTTYIHEDSENKGKTYDCKNGACDGNVYYYAGSGEFGVSCENSCSDITIYIGAFTPPGYSDSDKFNDASNTAIIGWLWCGAGTCSNIKVYCNPGDARLEFCGIESENGGGTIQSSSVECYGEGSNYNNDNTCYIDCYSLCSTNVEITSYGNVNAVCEQDCGSGVTVNVGVSYSPTSGPMNPTSAPTNPTAAPTVPTPGPTSSTKSPSPAPSENPSDMSAEPSKAPISGTREPSPSPAAPPTTPAPSTKSPSRAPSVGTREPSSSPGLGGVGPEAGNSHGDDDFMFLSTSGIVTISVVMCCCLAWSYVAFTGVRYYRLVKKKATLSSSSNYQNRQSMGDSQSHQRQRFGNSQSLHEGENDNHSNVVGKNDFGFQSAPMAVPPPVPSHVMNKNRNLLISQMQLASMSENEQSSFASEMKSQNVQQIQLLQLQMQEIEQMQQQLQEVQQMEEIQQPLNNVLAGPGGNFEKIVTGNMSDSDSSDDDRKCDRKTAGASDEVFHRQTPEPAPNFRNYNEDDGR